MDASLMSTAGNQRKSKPRVRVLPEEGYILDLSVCSCAALPAFRSRSQQAESQRPNPSIRFTRKARSFSTVNQGRSRAGPGTGRPVPHRPPRRFHGAGRRAAAAACRRFIPPQCDGTGASRAGASGFRTHAPILFGFVGCARRWRRENRAWQRFRRVSHRR
jgi:hypothetical protein